MSITKPYTFQPNTKARANEVNANFDTLYSQANTNISNIEANARDIDDLNDTKAELNGNSSQRFAAANAINDTDVVNKQSLIKYITNSIDYINGLVITKDTNSPNDTIIVSAGSCYDSSRTIILSLSGNTSKQNVNQGANTTYNVYIIGNDTGTSTDVLISSSTVEPALPSGYTKYRLIGNFTTDREAYIDSIVSLSNSVTYTSSQITAICMPDYYKAVSLGTAAGNYSIPVDAECYIAMSGGNYACTVTCNGQPVYFGTNNINYNQPKGSTFLAPKNSIVNLSAGVATFKYYPLKGA